MKIILKGTPMSTQNCYRSVCRGSWPKVYMKKECKDLKEDYQWQVKRQWKQEPLEGPLNIKIVIFFGTKRRADWDNFNKIAIDALEGVVFLDDSQIIEATVIKDYDKENPRIEIEIYD